MSSTHRTDATVRLFVALPIPAPVRATVCAFLSRHVPDDEQLRRTRPEGWHVTLAYLGETPAARLPEVVQVARVALARHPLPHQIQLGRAGRFAHHTLWLGIDEEPPGSIARLGGDLQSRLAEADLPVTRREVNAHITIARARRRGRVSQTHVRALEQAPTTSWRPAGIEVWEAHLGEGPARYTSAASVAHPDTDHQDEAAGSSAVTDDGC